MRTRLFPIPKREFFREVKESKHLRGGVRVYAAQENVKLDAEIAEKGRFGMETKLNPEILAVRQHRTVDGWPYQGSVKRPRGGLFRGRALTQGLRLLAFLWPFGGQPWCIRSAVRAKNRSE